MRSPNGRVRAGLLGLIRNRSNRQLRLWIIRPGDNTRARPSIIYVKSPTSWRPMRRMTVSIAAAAARRATSKLIVSTWHVRCETLSYFPWQLERHGEVLQFLILTSRNCGCALKNAGISPPYTRNTHHSAHGSKRGVMNYK